MKAPVDYMAGYKSPVGDPVAMKRLKEQYAMMQAFHDPNNIVHWMAKCQTLQSKVDMLEQRIRDIGDNA